MIDVIDDEGPVIRSGSMLERPIPQDRPVLRRVVQGALVLAVVGAVLAWFFPGAL
ncbi:MAG: hypothetical protein GY913_34490 [Proteobacteria bacterium]|nr:hypothetical protein [Pseudomonadota bacterium]MCP4922039.1 hypothetical protein [Pseudomonadota bacterium]